MSNEATLQKVAEELTGRIGQVTARYEGELAVLRVQAQEQVESLQKQVQELQKQLWEATQKVELDKTGEA